MDRIDKLWSAYGGWFLIAIPVAVIALCLVVSAAKPETRTIAEPSTETEITFDMDKNRAYTAEDGVIVIGGTVTPIADKTGVAPIAAIEKTTTETAPIFEAEPVKIGGMYTLPEDAQMSDGSIGLLSIPKLGLSVNVFEIEDEMEAMTRGLAHFKTTSAWSGNVGLCGVRPDRALLKVA